MAPAASTRTGLNWGACSSPGAPAHPVYYLPLSLAVVASSPLGPPSPGGSSGYVPGVTLAPHRNPETVWEDNTRLSQQPLLCWPPATGRVQSSVAHPFAVDAQQLQITAVPTGRLTETLVPWHCWLQYTPALQPLLLTAATKDKAGQSMVMRHKDNSVDQLCQRPALLTDLQQFLWGRSERQTDSTAGKQTGYWLSYPRCTLLQ